MLCHSAEHAIYYFPQFRDLAPVDRLREAKRLALCINCLKADHQLRHHTLLHLDGPPSSQPHVPVSSSSHTEPSVPLSTSSTLIAQDLGSDLVLLATATVLVQNLSGLFVPCRALLILALNCTWSPLGLQINCNLRGRGRPAPSLESGIPISRLLDSR